MSKAKITDYIKATRPHLAIFFLEVIIGAILALDFNVLSLDLKKLIIIFISFQSLYYGLYVLNDIIDYKHDKLSSRKQHRPIASGIISRKNAFIFSLILIMIAFFIAFETYRALVYFEFFFLGYILVYTLCLKKIPYVDTLSGGVTHTARVIMGFYLFGGMFNYYFFALFLLLLFSSFLLIKRMKEIKYKEHVRRPIKYYSEKKIKIFWALSVPVSLILLYFSKNNERLIIGVLLIIYIFAISLYFKSAKIKKLFEKIAD